MKAEICEDKLLMALYKASRTALYIAFCTVLHTALHTAFHTAFRTAKMEKKQGRNGVYAAGGNTFQGLMQKIGNSA